MQDCSISSALAYCSLAPNHQHIITKIYFFTPLLIIPMLPALHHIYPLFDPFIATQSPAKCLCVIPHHGILCNQLEVGLVKWGSWLIWWCCSNLLMNIPMMRPPPQKLFPLTSKLFELSLWYLAQRIYGSGEMYWMTFPWPWPKVTAVASISKNLLVCTIKWEPLIGSLQNVAALLP